MNVNLCINVFCPLNMTQSLYGEPNVNGKKKRRIDEVSTKSYFKLRIKTKNRTATSEQMRNLHEPPLKKR